MTPRMEMAEMECDGAVLALSSDEIGFGGSAKDNQMYEADVNENHGWELW